MNLRVSYGFPLFGNSRLEAIGEVFNLFNAKNPGTFPGSQLSSNFMQPTEVLGRLPEPRAARRADRVPV